MRANVPMLAVAAATVGFSSPLHAQESSLPFFEGDSIRYELRTDQGTSVFTGVVHALKNPRSCLYFVIATNEGFQYGSFGVRVHEGQTLEVLTRAGEPLPVPQPVTVEELRELEIECVEASLVLNDFYLRADSAADGSP